MSARSPEVPAAPASDPDGPDDSPVRRRPRYRREQILTAAAQLFRDKGYWNTSIDDIGRAVGITGGALYRHFASKEVLLVELYERMAQDYLRAMHAVLAEGMEPQETLDRLIDIQVSGLTENRGLAIIEHERRNLPQGDRDRLNRLVREVQATWIDVLRAIRPALSKEEARVLVVALSGMLSALSTHDFSLSTTRFQELVRSALLASLLDAGRS